MGATSDSAAQVLLLPCDLYTTCMAGREAKVTLLVIIIITMRELGSYEAAMAGSIVGGLDDDDHPSLAAGY